MEHRFIVGARMLGNKNYKAFVQINNEWKEIKTEGSFEMPIDSWTKFFDDLLEDDIYLNYIDREEVQEDMRKTREGVSAELGIDRIKAQGPALITFWDDGSRTVSKYDIDTEVAEYNVLVPLLMNILKKKLTISEKAALFDLIDEIDMTEFNDEAKMSFDTWIADKIDDPLSFRLESTELRRTMNGDITSICG